MVQVLSEDNLNQLDELYQAISPSREESGYSQRLTTAAEHLVAILDGKDRQVVGTTYKEIKELIDLISGCGYFENLSSEAEPVEGKEEAVVNRLFCDILTFLLVNPVLALIFYTS